jgi:hypothetical protein
MKFESLHKRLIKAMQIQVQTADSQSSFLQEQYRTIIEKTVPEMKASVWPDNKTEGK